MELVTRSNGIIIRDYPSFKPIHSDNRKALEKALAQLREFHPGIKPANWNWDDTILSYKRPDKVRTAKQPELLLVVAGAGDIKSDDLTDWLDHGYWAFIPKGVTYSLAGRVISGMNFRVFTLPLQV